MRLEGPEPSVAFRRERLIAELAGECECTCSKKTPRAIFGARSAMPNPFAALTDRTVWRVSVAPARGAEVGEAIARAIDAVWFLDWGGGLVWVAVAGIEDGGAEVIRAAIRGPDGHGTGHATLIKGSAALRCAVPVFEPQASALAALSDRIKDSFDPRHILNPGRMVERS